MTGPYWPFPGRRRGISFQGLVTNDVVNGLARGPAYTQVCCRPRVKVLFDFLVTEGDGALLLDVAREQRDALLKKS
jgi:folate-binding Fe-S cluster repair protein YgfZ